MLLRRSLSIIAVMLVALLLLAACAEEETTTRTGQYGGIYKQLGQDTCLDFGWPPAAGDKLICNLPCTELLAYQYSDGTLEPRLATSWELASDRSYLTINLRQGVKFHDGSDFNAEAVKFAMEDYTVQGTRVNWGEIDVIDDYTVRVNFNKAYQNTFVYETLVIGMPSKASAEENGIDWARNNAVGTGAFKMVSFERDVKLVYTRNDDYWQEGLPYLDGIEITVIADPMTSSLAMQAGEGDALHMEGSKIVTDLIAAGFDYDGRNDASTALWPDGANPDSPYYDERVRQAIEYAIDRDALVAATGFGLATASYQGPLSWQLGYDPDFEGRQYDPDKARQLLEDAGYADGFETTIYPFPAGSIFTMDEAVIVQQFFAKVGIDAEIDVIDFGQWSQLTHEGWHNGLIGYVYPGTGSGNPNLKDMNLALGPQPDYMVSTYNSDEFRALLAESCATTELDEELIEEMYRYMFDKAMVIPIHSMMQGFVVREGIHDTGYMDAMSWQVWTPEKIWMEQ